MEDDEDAVAAMIHYFYHFDYENDQTDATAFDIAVLIVADKYMIPPLRRMASHEIAERLLKEWGKESSRPFAEAIQAIYSLDTPYKDMLKPSVMEVIKDHRALFRNSEKYAAFHDALRKVDGLGADVAVAIASDSRLPDKSSFLRCPQSNCATAFAVDVGRSESICCPRCGARKRLTDLWWL